MSGVDRSVLAGLKPFAGWAAADLDALLAPAHARRFDKGASVFEQGAAADSFFLLLDGHVQASKLTPDGRQIIVRYIDPGELFGIAAQIRETTYPATAKAVVESLVWSGRRRSGRNWRRNSRRCRRGCCNRSGRGSPTPTRG